MVELINLEALHSMLIEMHGGMLTLATVCIVGLVAAKFYWALRKRSQLYGVLWPLDSLFEWVTHYAEPTAFVAAIGGVIGLIVSSITGYFVWPAEELLNRPLALNKIMFAIFATELWVVFIAIRGRYGEALWKHRGLSATYVCAGLGGFFFMVLTGSMGGHMAGKGSVLDPLYEALGISPENPWFIGTEMILPSVVAALAIAVILLLTARMLSRTKA
jgi:hypothetical protein